MIRPAFANITIAFVGLLVFVSLGVAPQAQAQIVAKGDWIKLGEVAPVTGEAADILLGAAPPAGQKLALDPVFVTSVAKKAGVILAIPLDQPIWVTRSGGNAPPAKVANVAKQATPAPQIAGNAKPGAVLVLVRDVPRGQVITDDDLDWSDKLGAFARNGIADLSAAVGMEARRGLKSGQALQAMDIKQADLIKKGDPVKLIYAAKGMRLTVQGLAQGDAGKGESVRILNSYSKRTVEAIASAAGEARVMSR
jgi:flagella basal body P-ring formation protein FlgA